MQMNDQETMKNLVVVLLFHIPKYIYIYILEEGWMAMAIFGP